MEALEPLVDWNVAACSALIATIVSLWCRPQWLWIALLAIATACGYGAGILHGPAVVWPLLLSIALLVFRQSAGRTTRAVACVFIVCLTIALGVHALPGFHNPLLARDVVLSPKAAPYSLYFNFDKTFAGVLLLGIAAKHVTRPNLLTALRTAAPIIVVNVGIGIALSLALGYVEPAPKWTAFFWTWALVNLLLTCMSEEAFFRAFVQRELHVALGRSTYAGAIAVSVSALLFGVAHSAGGWRYVLLATLAGAGYALVYQRTQRVELSMLAHFLLNATHFLFFTYPYLA